MKKSIHVGNKKIPLEFSQDNTHKYHELNLFHLDKTKILSLAAANDETPLIFYMQGCMPSKLTAKAIVQEIQFLLSEVYSRHYTEDELWGLCYVTTKENYITYQRYNDPGFNENLILNNA